MIDILNLLHGVVKFIGGMLVIFGLVSIGLTLKDGISGGSQLSGGITMVVAGGCVLAVGSWV